MPDIRCDPNVIFGPVIPARNGWGYEIFTRMDDVVGSYIPRVHRSARAAAVARQELIKLDRAYVAARSTGTTAHDCRSDEDLLATNAKGVGGAKRGADTAGQRLSSVDYWEVRQAAKSSG